MDFKSQTWKPSIQRKTVKEPPFSLPGGPVRLMHPVDQPTIYECTFPLSHTTYLCIIYRSLYRAISHLKGKRGFFIMSLREGLAIFMCALKTSKIGWWHRRQKEWRRLRVTVSTEQLYLQELLKPHPVTQQISTFLKAPPQAHHVFFPVKAFVLPFCTASVFSFSLPHRRGPHLDTQSSNPRTYNWIIPCGYDVQHHYYVLYFRDLVIKQIFIALGREPHYQVQYYVSGKICFGFPATNLQKKSLESKLKSPNTYVISQVPQRQPCLVARASTAVPNLQMRRFFNLCQPVG